LFYSNNARCNDINTLCRRIFGGCMKGQFIEVAKEPHCHITAGFMSHLQMTAATPLSAALGFQTQHCRKFPGFAPFVLV